MLTIPRDNSWKTRERTGGGVGITPVSMLATTSRWIQWMMTSHLSEQSRRSSVLSFARSTCARTSNSISSWATEFRAEQNRRLISVAKIFWKAIASGWRLASVVVKAIRLLNELNHSPRAWSNNEPPSHHRAYAWLDRKVSIKVKRKLYATKTCVVRSCGPQRLSTIPRKSLSKCERKWKATANAADGAAQVQAFGKTEPRNEKIRDIPQSPTS
mmetsp:Transcript_59615/g.172672  ORF Transcript_59615/g.172672 Transcript_59615/m.172672 type:complete len:214 (+) Transcript_59615:1126-1767(+)